jgi:transcriptional regulator with GAF, ATPase, and Fis domain
MSATESERERLQREARALWQRAQALGHAADLVAIWQEAARSTASPMHPAAPDSAARTTLPPSAGAIRAEGALTPASNPAAAALPSGAVAGPSGAVAPGRYGMLGQSPGMLKVYGLLDRLCNADVPVLIHGETGTGKELVARALHAFGRRSKKRFVAVNCAAVPANLLESELFGHTRGAFTGAHIDRPGQFVVADGGTLFLDEIGDMPLEMQVKLLRVLQEGEVRPVGSNRTQKVDVRVVAASHKNLEELVRSGLFRQDLFYRLNVVAIPLPPLRERGADLPLLIQAFLERLAAAQGRPVPQLTPRALAALVNHRWPGNVRELDNELSRALALGGPELDLEDLSAALRAGAPKP